MSSIKNLISEYETYILKDKNVNTSKDLCDVTSKFVEQHNLPIAYTSLLIEGYLNDSYAIDKDFRQYIDDIKNEE